MLPLALLNSAKGHAILVELKNGETLNGHLVKIDMWMNITLKEVVQTNSEGDRFYKIPEVYVRGNNLKYLRVEEEVLDKVRERQAYEAAGRQSVLAAWRGETAPGRGDHGGGGDRGGGRGDRGRGRYRPMRGRGRR